MKEQTEQIKTEVVLSCQEYAILLLQMLQDFRNDLIKVDTVIFVVKMLTKHTIENAVIYATDDSYAFGAVEFDYAEDVDNFVGQLSENVLYATVRNEQFTVYQYPYRSRVINEWVFVDFARVSPV